MHDKGAVHRPTTMQFATNSVRNTTLATEDDDPYLEVVTRFWHPYVTKINRLDPATRKMTTVCEIETKPKSAPRIRFLDVDKMDVLKGESKGENLLGDWMSTDAILAMAPEKPGGIFTDADGTQYRWKTHNRNFQLIRCGDDTRLPVVVFHPCKRHFGVWRMSKHASLEIKPGIKNLEKLIASYLLVERKRRHNHL